MVNSRYFKDNPTKIGGTANPAHKAMYVDSHNGLDTNVGSNVAPMKTIQGARTAAIAAGMTSTIDFILAGTFREGDFTGSMTVSTIIAEGLVTIDGVLNNSFSGFTRFNMYYTPSDTHNYGRLIIKNFINTVNVSSTYFNNTEFHNCRRMWLNTPQYVFQNCLVKDCNSESYVNNYYCIMYLFENNTFINTDMYLDSTTSTAMRNNYFDIDSTVKFRQDFISAIYDYNHYEGSRTGRMNYGGNFDSIEDLKIAQPDKFGSNNIGSAVDPLFNDITKGDYTLQSTSPILYTGYERPGLNKRYIGAFGVAKRVGASDATWVLSGIDNTTVPGTASLITSPGVVGTMSTQAPHIFISASKVVIDRINLPNLVEDKTVGGIVGNKKVATATTMTDVNIQYSENGGSTYNGTWLRVPVGTQPYHDLVNDVGNDDVNYNHDEAIPISATHIMMSVTMINDEVPVI